MYIYLFRSVPSYLVNPLSLTHSLTDPLGEPKIMPNICVIVVIKYALYIVSGIGGQSEYMFKAFFDI